VSKDKDTKKDKRERKREKAPKPDKAAKREPAVARPTPPPPPTTPMAAAMPTAPTAPPAPPAPAAPAGDGAPLRRLVDAVAGARLCYGEPVQAGGRTVIPVSRIKVAGGYGFGRGRDRERGDGDGGGGGGSLDARPVGFIEITPEGTHYHDIPDPDRLARNVKAAAAAATALLIGLAGARRLLRPRRSPSGLLRSGR
jgi:uncharacterized spore protein YtfJ